jgi:hypothetical protein
MSVEKAAGYRVTRYRQETEYRVTRYLRLGKTTKKTVLRGTDIITFKNNII